MTENKISASTGKEDQQKSGRGKTGRIIKWEGDIPLPDIPNVNYASLMLQIFEMHEDKTALVETTSSKSYTYEELRNLILRNRDELAAAGVTEGDAVVVVTSNHIEMPAAMLGIILLGAACVPVNPGSTVDELAHVIRVSEAKWAVVNKEVVEKTEAAFSFIGSGTLKQVWVMGDASGIQLASGYAVQPQPQKHVSKTNEFDAAKTVALMPFSSGTTGLPKGVMLSHRNLVTTIIQNRFMRSLNPNVTINFHESTLLILPIYHMYGYNMTMNTLMSGGKVVLLTKFSAKDYFQAIQNHKVTFSPLVPHVMRFLVESPILKNYDLSSLYGFSTGSAPVSETTLESLTNKTGRITLQGYAMTESSGIATTNRGLPGSNSASVGTPGPFFQAKVIDVQTGDILGEGEEGEVCLRGPSIMMGYANNPNATAETIDPDGWLHTGDIGYFDEDNMLYITDRMKDLIKVKGYQVSPTELENIIMKMENVSDVGVVGVPNLRLGEAPRAFVVPAQGATVDLKALIKHVADHVLPYKQLAGGVEIVKSLPKNHIGKILRRELRKAYTETKSKL